MIPPPKKLADSTVKAYAAYRDAEIYHLPTDVQARFFERAQALFARLVKAMRCDPNESWMVSSNIAHMVHNTPPSKKPPTLRG